MAIFSWFLYIGMMIAFFYAWKMGWQHKVFYPFAAHYLITRMVKSFEILFGADHRRSDFSFAVDTVLKIAVIAVLIFMIVHPKHSSIESKEI